MDPTLAFLVKIFSIVLALAKAEVFTRVGNVNVFFAIVLPVLTYLLADKILANATLDWAARTGVGAIILSPIFLGVVLSFLMLIASLFLVYKDSTGGTR